METTPCGRCGRDRPTVAFHADDFHASTHLAPEGATQGAWASFLGEDVCPDCQSTEERREVAERVVALIEGEIERRQRTGVPSDAYEAALVAYAMAIRARHDVTSDEDDVPISARPERIDGPGSISLRVAVTGAFLTDYPLAVRIDGYAALQHDLSSELAGPQWRLDGLRLQGGTYESGGGFSEEVPLVIARRDGADFLPWLASAVERVATGTSDEAQTNNPIRAATPRRLVMDIYDLGVGVITAWFDVAGSPGAELEAIARSVKRLAWLRSGADHGRSKLVDALQQIALSTAREYGDAILKVVPGHLRAAWLSRATPPASTGSPAAPSNDDLGRLLWLHPVHVLVASAGIEEAAHQLAPACEKR